MRRGAKGHGQSPVEQDGGAEGTAAPLKEYLRGDLGGRLLVIALLILIAIVAYDRNSGSGGVFAPKGSASSVTGRQFINSAESLGDVLDMLVSVGLETYFSTLRNNGMTNLNTIASHEGACPGDIKPFHCRRLKNAAYSLLVPDGERDIEHDEEEEELPVASADQLRATVCNSWANTRGAHFFMKDFRKLKEGTFVNVTVPACAKDKRPDRGVLYGIDQNTEDTKVTSVVGNDNGWFRNELTLGVVGKLRQRGVLDQFVFDKERRIMYCGNPKAGLTFLKSWLLKHYNLWKLKDPKKISHAFTGKEEHRLVSGKHMKDTELLEALNSGGYFKVTFVRDPLTRALAAYHDRFYDCHRRASPVECRQWVQALTGMPKRRGRSDAITFRQFVLMLMKLHKKGSALDVTYQTAHWLPQTTVCALDQIAYDFIGRIETEDKDTQLLYDVSNFQAMTASQRRAVDPTLIVGGLIQHLGADPDSVTRNIQALQTLYERDNFLLGYQGESLLQYLQSGDHQAAGDTIEHNA